MKRHLLLITFSALALLIMVTPSDAFAQNPQDPSGGYQLLVDDLPFVSQVPEGSGLEGYLGAFFQLGLAIAVLLSVVIFTYNGVLYMTSDVIGKKGEARSGMQSAILGLVLAFSAWLILRTINPSLVDFQLFRTLAEIREEVSTPPPAPPTASTTPPGEESARAAMKALGVGINQDACAPGQGAPTCINVAGLHPAAVGVLGRLAANVGVCPEDKWPNNCPVASSVIITGGTEPNHQTHGVGKPVFDLKSKTGNTQALKLNTYIRRNSRRCNDYKGWEVWLGGSNSQTYFWLEETGGQHWHVCVGKDTPECSFLVNACVNVTEE